MNFRRNIRAELPGFPLTPMMDVVFLLLCFFVTSQLFSQWETELEITLPTAGNGDIPQRYQGEIILNVRDTGDIVVNGRALDTEGLSGLLGRISTLFPGQPVVVRADRATAYEHVIRVLDVCRSADIWNISFATLHEKEPGEP